MEPTTWVKFSEDFDYYPSFLVTIAYRAQETPYFVTADVAQKAITHGSAVEVSAPSTPELTPTPEVSHADAVAGEDAGEPSL